jgi:hypothetical protein
MDFSNWVCANFTDKKLGKGKDKIDDEDVTFQRMVAKVSALIHSLFFSIDTVMAFSLVLEIFIVILLSFLIF